MLTSTEAAWQVQGTKFDSQHQNKKSDSVSVAAPTSAPLYQKTQGT